MLKHTILDINDFKENKPNIVKYDKATLEKYNEAYSDRLIDIDRYDISKRPMIDICTTHVVPGDYLPVIRYEELYYRNNEETDVNKEGNTEKYNGKFYFYEPETMHHIYLGKYLIAGNKYNAMRMLESEIYGDFDEFDALKIGKVPHIPSIRLLAIITDTLDKSITGGCWNINDIIISPNVVRDFETIPDKLEYNVTSFEKQLSILLDISSLINGDNKSKDLNDTDKYTRYVHLNRAIFAIKSMERVAEGLDCIALTNQQLDQFRDRDIAMNFGSNIKVKNDKTTFKTKSMYHEKLFGKSDILDQPLVEYGKKCGYDTIILQQEIGSNNIITEVIDLRPRNITNIVSLNDQYIDVSSTKHPLIWTPEIGVITVE